MGCHNHDIGTGVPERRLEVIEDTYALPLGAMHCPVSTPTRGPLPRGLSGYGEARRSHSRLPPRTPHATNFQTKDSSCLRACGRWVNIPFSDSLSFILSPKFDSRSSGHVSQKGRATAPPPCMGSLVPGACQWHANGMPALARTTSVQRSLLEPWLAVTSRPAAA